ncbi:MAG: lysophospholipid acyltransferase family protein [Methylococcaceae bacterium]
MKAVMNFRLLYKLVFIVLLFSSGLIIAGIIFPLISLICSVNAAKSYKDYLKTLWLKVFSIIVALRITKIGQLPSQNVLLVSNHISWLDIIVIGQFLPAYFVAKSDILNWPIIGYLARQGGTIFIRRGDKQHILATSEKMLGLLKQQSNIIAFPEGTTTSGETVLNFHASLFQPALLTQSLVQPVVIQYTGLAKQTAPFIGDDEFASHLLKMLKLKTIDVQLSFLSPIETVGKTRQAVCHQSHALITEQLNN